MSLTPDQQAAFEKVKEGRNIFLTGPAGTGKSYLLSTIVRELQDEKRIALTAMTGCAALLLCFAGAAGSAGVAGSSEVKPRTLHSWAGIGLGKESISDLIKKVRTNYKTMKRWVGTDLLVVDEISMMTPELLEKLNEIGKAIRKDKRPFGGIQLLFVGDFFQLPPVAKGSDAQFAFESPLWGELIDLTVMLTTISRQKEPEFQQLLGEARIGKLSKFSADIIRSRMISWADQEIKPTLLYSRRADVDRINSENLKALKEPHRVYHASISFGSKAPKHLSRDSTEIQEATKRLDNDASYVPELEIAVGAQVMLVANVSMETGLVNGSRGVVVGFTESSEGEDVTKIMKLPLVKFRGGQVAAIEPHSWSLGDMEHVFRTQIPLRLAYAITCHKAQGATLDCALIDIGPTTFEYGQAYVALSRVKSLESLYIHSFDPKVVKAHPKVAAFYGAN
jgi:ATP-dependent DNA helicase PIF1